jgi:HlyD family secretion protein
VDAYPTDTFRGTVSQVRLEPTTVQNVVTYTAVVDVANPDLKLKPGMTANVTVSVAESDNVLSVPNTALRFHPDTAPAPRPYNSGPELWKVENGVPKPVNVQTGLTDGLRTEIVSGDLKEGDVIAVASTSTATKSAAAPAARSPFAAGGKGKR